MAETAIIALGGRQFEVRALTFRQLRDVEEALGRALKAGTQTRIDFDAAIDIVAAALTRADPTMNRDAILELEGTKADIVAATRTVLALSGYIDSGEPPPGEDRAGN